MRTVCVYIYILIIVYKKAIKNPLERLSGLAVRGPPASVSELLCPAAVCVCIFIQYYIRPPFKMRANDRRRRYRSFRLLRFLFDRFTLPLPLNTVTRQGSKNSYVLVMFKKRKKHFDCCDIINVAKRHF